MKEKFSPQEMRRERLSPQEEQQLLFEAQHGSERAFGALVDRHRPGVFRLLFRLTRHREDAENLTQEALLRAFQALHRFEGRSRFSTWLFRIASNLGLNHLGRRRAILLWNPLPQESPAPQPDGLEALESSERLEHLQQAIEQLPPRQRLTVLLRTYEELSFQEIADVLECSLGTAKSNHFHAVRSLQKLLVPSQNPSKQNKT